MILIDDIKTEEETTSLFTIDVDGNKFNGWQIAKPINNPTIIVRFKNAFKVFTNKAIAVQYFEDLTEEEQKEYVKSKLK